MPSNGEQATVQGVKYQWNGTQWVKLPSPEVLAPGGFNGQVSYSTNGKYIWVAAGSGGVWLQSPENGASDPAPHTAGTFNGQWGYSGESKFVWLSDGPGTGYWYPIVNLLLGEEPATPFWSHPVAGETVSFAGAPPTLAPEPKKKSAQWKITNTGNKEHVVKDPENPCGKAAHRGQATRIDIHLVICYGCGGTVFEHTDKRFRPAGKRALARPQILFKSNTQALGPPDEPEDLNYPEEPGYGEPGN